MAALRLPISNVPAGGDYTAAIKLGSTGAEVQVLLDTGSSSLGIVPNAQRYEPGADKSLTTTTLAQDVVYGTGGWAGPVVKTVAAMGGAPAVDAYVAVIDEQYEGFGEADGIMGLAYNALNQAHDISAYLHTHGGKTSSYPWPFQVRDSNIGVERLAKLLAKMPLKDLPPYFTALESGGAVANVFAFYTLRSVVSKATGDPAGDPLNKGWFILGGGPEQDDLYEGNFEDVAVVDDNYYNVELLAVQVGNADPTPMAPLAAEDAQAGSNAIVDSGTNSLALTTEAYEALVQRSGQKQPGVRGRDRRRLAIGNYRSETAEAGGLAADLVHRARPIGRAGEAGLRPLHLLAVRRRPSWTGAVSDRKRRDAPVDPRPSPVQQLLHGVRTRR